MAQKINPISLRLGKTNRNFDYCWFNTSSYVNLLMKDLKIQSYVNSILKKINYSSVRCLIQHLPNKIKINVFFCNLNKNFKHMSKISYLSHHKKIRKSRKVFFNRKVNHIYMKHGKVFNYLIKNFSINQNLLQMQQFKKINNSNIKLNPVTFLNSRLHKNNLIFLKNYFKLIYSIKKLNQFYIRYFLVKYLSTKFLGFKCESHNKKFSHDYSNNIHVYIFNFLFFKIYKNKIFLALNYYRMKVCNYKIMLIYYNNLLNENIIQPTWLAKKKQKLKIKFKYPVTNSNFKITFKKFKINLNSNTDEAKKIGPHPREAGASSRVQVSNQAIFSRLNKHVTESCTSLHILNFITKLKIYNYIQQFPSDPIKHLTQANKSKYKLNLNENLLNKCIELFHHANLNNNFICLTKPNKNLKPWINLNFNKLELSPTFESFNEKYPQLSWLMKKNKETNWLLYSENQKYYDLSLINNQCLNDSYKHYCNLNEYYKYYNLIFLNKSKKMFLLSREKLEKNKIPSENFITNTRNKIIPKVNSNILAHLKLNPKNNTLVTLMNSPYKQHLESIIYNSFSCNTNFTFFQTTNTFQNALFLIDEIIYYIEKRIPFFKIKNYILKKLAEEKNLPIKGIRVTCSGRIGGKSKKAQRSKIQSFKYGETSLHVFSSKIDFFSKNAFTSFGTLGLKVWICYY